MLWAIGGFVVKFLEVLLHVAWHGDVDISFGIVLGEGEATVLCPFPINEHSYVPWMASIKWSASYFEKYWMPKSSTQSVKVVLREGCFQSPGVWGMGL